MPTTRCSSSNFIFPRDAQIEAALDRVQSIRVCVRESQIHRLGLFCIQKLPRHSIVTYYDGEHIDWKTAKERPDARYMRTVHFGHHVIDGLRAPIPGRGLGSFANHSDNPNCKYHRSGDSILLKLTKPIDAGDEILVNYGRTYWNNVDCEPISSCTSKETARSIFL